MADQVIKGLSNILQYRESSTMFNSGDDVVDCLEKWGQQQYNSFFFWGLLSYAVICLMSPAPFALTLFL